MTAAARTVEDLLRAARARLPEGEAEWLLAHVLGRSHAWLLAFGEHAPDADAAGRFEALVDRRVAGEPVAYLTGQRGFWSLDLAVSPAVLIPRPETERLVELALERLPDDRPTRVLDLGTGSGAIALAIARERPLAQVTAIDASEAALAVARGNAARNGIGNVGFAHGDWYAGLDDPHFELIASNPPYIALDDPHLAHGDLRFEPAIALSSGADGLDAIRTIVTGARDHLDPGGWLLVEHGWQQGAAVRALMTAAGLLQARTVPDLEQRERVTLARAPG